MRVLIKLDVRYTHLQSEVMMGHETDHRCLTGGGQSLAQYAGSQHLHNIYTASQIVKVIVIETSSEIWFNQKELCLYECVMDSEGPQPLQVDYF